MAYNLGPIERRNDLGLDVSPPDYSQGFGLPEMPIPPSSGAVSTPGGSSGGLMESLGVQAQPQQPQGGGLGIGDILGKIGEVMSAMSSGYSGRPDPLVQRKLQEAQLARQDQQMQMEGLKTTWGIIKDLTDAGNVAPEHAPILAAQLNKLSKGAVSTELIASMLGNTNTREMVQRTFPLAMKQLGVDGTLKTLKTLGVGTLKDMEKTLTEQDIKTEVRQAREKGLIKEGMSQMDAEKVVPRIAQLASEDVTAYGIVTGKEKSEIRREGVRAAADATREDQRDAARQQRAAAGLRAQFLTQAKDFVDVRDSYNRVGQAAKTPSPAGDLSMIFAYMKMLDPRSVVRESEFRVAETARPLLERAGISWDRVNAVWEGKRLTDSQRTDFTKRAQDLYGQQEKSHVQLENEFRRIATISDINPDKVIVDLKTKSSGGGDSGTSVRVRLKNDPGKTGTLQFQPGDKIIIPPEYEKY